MFRRLAILLALSALLPVAGYAAASLPAATSAAPQLMAITVDNDQTATRLVIGLSSHASFTVTAKANPDRVEIDSPALVWPQSVAASGVGAGLVTVYRQATSPGGGTRIVLETEAPVNILSAGSGLTVPGQPTSFTVSMVSADGSPPPPALASSKITSVAYVAPPLPPVSVSKAAESQPLPTALGDMHEAMDVKPSHKIVHAKHVIAIDPGHGGIDPGTASSDNVFEKNLTLQAGLALKAVLEATGRYTVVMTRDQDRFVPLQDRVKLARAAKAELFVSLHCDAMEGRDAHGATIYTLSQNASDAVSDRLASQENRAAAIGGVDLARTDDGVATTLIDLSMRQSLNQSNEFAELLVGQFGERAIGLQELKPHRSAGFAVLKAADMPSVLIEMGYLSDPTDAQLLASPKHQHQVAEAITAGVDRYFRVPAK